AVGAGRSSEAARTARHGLVLALFLAIPVGLFVANAGFVLRLAGQQEAIVVAAESYLKAVALSFPGAFAVVALRGVLAGHGDTRPIMFVAVGGVLFNAGANQVMIFGELGFPALGLPGAGYATSLTYAVMAATLGAIIARRYPSVRVFGDWRDHDPRLYREILAVGWPIGLALAFEGGMFSAGSLVIGSFGEAPLAAHQIAVQMSPLTFMVPLGVGIAAGIRVAQAAGRRDDAAARLAGRLGIAVAAGFMLLTATFYLSVPRAIVGLFLDLADPRNGVVVGYATSFLVLAGVFQIFD